MTKLNLKLALDVKDNDYEVVEFHGELDKSTISGAEVELEKIVENFEREYLIFDFGGLVYINSEGIGLLISVHAKLAKNKKHLLFIGAKRNVMSVFELIGLQKLIPIFNRIDEAIKYIKKQ